MKLQYITKIITLSLVTAVSFSGSIIPAEAYQSKAQIVQDDEDVKRLAVKLEKFLGTTIYVKDNHIHLREDVITHSHGKDSLRNFRTIVTVLNGQKLQQTHVEEFTGGKREKRDYMGCLGNQIYHATGAGMTAGVVEAVRYKNWNKAAHLLIKFVGKNAIRGGVYGLAGSLAWWSLHCVWA